MSYDVQTEDRAEDELAAIWLATTDQTAVTTAMNRIDQALRSRPLIVGRPRGSSVNRVYSVGVLAVEYDVIEDDKRVMIRAVFVVPG